MKHVVSVSLGSHHRNHSVETEIRGEKFRIERMGTDGDLEKAISLVKSLDGKVDAFGMGGIDLYIQAGKNRYMFRDAKRIADAAKVTPIVDGSGLKNTLERKAILYLNHNRIIDFANKNVLLVCGVDRFGMAEALVATGANVSFGDLAFSLNLPIMIKSLDTLGAVAKVFGPIVSQLPFKLLYPTGNKQEQEGKSSRHREYYDSNEIIAGDFLYIKRYLPDTIDGKIIITNTVTREDVETMKQRGARLLITTTPELQGRSFGTNVMEAVLVALLGKPQSKISEEDYNRVLDQVNFTPRVIDFTVIKTA